MRSFLFTTAFLALSNVLHAQNVFPASGNVGIGTTTPSVDHKLDVRGGISAVGGETRLSNTVFTDPASGIAYGLKIGGGGMAVVGNAFFVNKIGIGTSNFTEMLSVNGKIRAKEVKVENVNWPDYVFSSSYKLPKLDEIENYIQQNGHLPGIPSAKQVAQDGVALSEMNAALLSKIEELTLILIQQEKVLLLQDQKLNAQDVLLKQIITKLGN